MLESAAEFHFLRPWWLLLLMALPLVIGLQLRYARRANNWHRVIEANLFDALIASNSSGKSRAAMTVPALVLLCATIALAGPTYERLPQRVETKQDPLVIVLDLTLSMTATDLKPSRAERAKFKISDILERREEGLTGLVVYAGDAYVVTPLSRDDATLLNLLPSLGPEMMPVRGSNAAPALRMANAMLDSVRQETGQILLITDGIAGFDRLRNEVNSQYNVSILGVGTTTAGHSNGRSTELNEALLQDFAMVAGGRYRTIETSDADIAYLLADPMLAATELLEDQLFDAWHDLGYYFVIPIACLLALVMRRGGLVLVLVIVGVQIQAGWLEDLWIPQDKQAHAAHERGEFKKAAETFEDVKWRGIAKYRAGEFAEAGDLFAREPGPSFQYNQGNALAWEGRFDEAIAAYANVLEVEPDHADALHNKAVLEKLLEDLKQTQQQQQPNDSNQSQNGEQQESQQQQRSDQKQEPQQQQNESNSPNQSEQEQAESSQNDETQQAQANQPEERHEEQEETEGNVPEVAESAEEREMREIHERWLRRIPNDPSGLLQRKFKAESDARIERGELNQGDIGPAW